MSQKLIKDSRDKSCMTTNQARQMLWNASESVTLHYRQQTGRVENPRTDESMKEGSSRKVLSAIALDS